MRLLADRFGLSIRRSCRLVGLARCTWQYHPRRPEDTAVRARLTTLAAQRPRWGCPRLHVLLRREGWSINHKRTERLYRLAGLALRRRRRRQRAVGRRLERVTPQAVNQAWSMDFVHDRLGNGRRFRCLTLVDDYSRECPAIAVETSLSGHRVVQVLDRLAETRGLPQTITVDNGPEFAGTTLDGWAYRRGVHLRFIEPGKPVQNAYIESFNGKFREECLSGHWFTTMLEAQHVIERWRHDYNTERPHSALGGLTPLEFVQQQPPSSADLRCPAA